MWAAATGSPREPGSGHRHVVPGTVEGEEWESVEFVCAESPQCFDCAHGGDGCKLNCAWAHGSNKEREKESMLISFSTASIKLFLHMGQQQQQ